MAEGDTQLMMNMCLVVLGAVFFFVGIGSHNWVKDEVKGNFNSTIDYYGLWTLCHDDSVNVARHSYCKDLDTGTMKGRVD
jgi:hypothetical protein